MVKPHSVGRLLQVEGADPIRDRTVLHINGVRSIVVVAADSDQAAAVALELVEQDGVALIELDGGLGMSGAAQIIGAIAGAVPVGAVMFGAKSLTAAAEFIARHNA
jgi:hypothetical protein